MPASSSARAVENAFELKARSFTLPTMRLLSTDMDLISDTLAAKVRQAPEFFRNMPVVIDVEELAQTDVEVDFPLLVGLLRGYSMIPVGVRGGNSRLNAAALVMELAVMSSPRPVANAQPVATQGGQQSAVESRPSPPAASPPPPSSVGSKLVNRHVRSGQRVYAQGGDLIVAASVSPGAEVLADGNIHVYGTLRGRAMAGVKGDAEARIFCHNLQAELVSIAGHYRLSESFRTEEIGRPVQVYLQERKLIIESLL